MDTVKSVKEIAETSTVAECRLFLQRMRDVAEAVCVTPKVGGLWGKRCTARRAGWGDG